MPGRFYFFQAMANTVDAAGDNVFHGLGDLGRRFFIRLNAIPMGFDMQKIFLLISLVGALFLCGCNQQAKINSQKIDLLTQNIIQLEQKQNQQMAILQSELISIAPNLNKANNIYFEKNHDDALFFHTNTLFLLLTIGKQIEAQLQVADTERNAQNSQIYNYHTNQLEELYLCTAQIETALNNQKSWIQDAQNGQEKRLEENVNSQIGQANAALSDALQKQIQAAAKPDADEIAWQTKMAADVAQIQSDLVRVKTWLIPMTNQPVAKP